MRKVCKTMLMMLIMLLLTCLSGIVAFAGNGDIDLNRKGSVTVSLYESEGEHKPVNSADFTIYQVAAVKTDVKAGWKYVLTEDFADCGISISDLNADGMAERLEGFAQDADLTGTKAYAGTTNSAVFKNLELGIYLIRENGYIPGYYPVKPFLVTVPMADSDQNGWIYDVDASPKLETRTTDSENGNISMKVKKVWEGEDKKRPAEVTVELRNGETVFDTVVLNAKNEWSHTWTELSRDGDWKIREVKVPKNYKVSYSVNGMEIVVKNTFSKPYGLIQTGQLNWPVPILAGAGVVLFAFGWILVFARRNGNEA